LLRVSLQYRPYCWRKLHLLLASEAF